MAATIQSAGNSQPPLGLVKATPAAACTMMIVPASSATNRRATQRTKTPTIKAAPPSTSNATMAFGKPFRQAQTRKILDEARHCEHEDFQPRVGKRQHAQREPQKKSRVWNGSLVDHLISPAFVSQK